MYDDISIQRVHVSLPLKHLLLSLHPDFSVLDWVGRAGPYAPISARPVSSLSLILCNRLDWNLLYHPYWNGNPLVFASQVLQLQPLVTTVNLALFTPQDLFISLCLCICPHVWNQKRESDIPLYHSLPVLLRQDLSLNLGLTFCWDKLEASKPQKSICLWLPWNWGYRHRLVMCMLEPEAWYSWLHSNCA